MNFFCAKQFIMLERGIMKKFIILFLILIFASPVYSIPSYDPNNKAEIYDDSEIQEYGRQLEEKFHKKYTVQISPTHSRYIGPMNGYQKEVISPLFEYGLTHPPKYNYR